MIDRGRRSKTLSEVRPVKTISKNLQGFLEISPLQKEVLPSLKLRDDAVTSRILSDYRKINPQREIARISWVIQVCLTQNKNVTSVWLKERFTINKNSNKGPKYLCSPWNHQKPYVFWWFQGKWKLINLLKFALH